MSKPNSAVHVPPDIWSLVTQEDMTCALAGLKTQASTNFAAGNAATHTRQKRVAAAMGRLLPYLPLEATQEAVQRPCDTEAPND